MQRRLQMLLLMIGCAGITVSSYAQGTSISAASPEDYASFGYSVGISGDYAIVGAPFDDDGAAKPNAGLAYIFKRNGDVWTQQKVLKSSDLAQGDNFGHSVSISGDYAAVGAPFEDNVKGTDAGSVYVFQRSGTNWIQVKKLLASDGAGGDGFGWSVGISGTQVVGGAPFEANANGSFAGSAYVFGKSGTNWPQQKKLLAGDGDEFDQFGYSVSISGNYTLVGSPYEDGKGDAAGAVYLYNKGASGWVQVLKRTVGDGAEFDNFGAAVSISGDYLAVGAPYDDTGKGEDSGSMYIFRRSGSSLIQEAKKTASDGTPFANLGYGVAIHSSGYAMAGAPETFDGGHGYVFRRVLNNGTPQWQQHRLYSNDNGAPGDRLGASVGLTTTYGILGAPSSGNNNPGRAEIVNYTAPLALAGDPSNEESSESPDELAISKSATEVPESFTLLGNYPNPFNPATTIRFDLPQAADVTLEVVNLMGQLVLRSEHRGLSAGANQQIQLDGSQLASGTYLYRLTAVIQGKASMATGRMVLIK